MSRGFIRLFEAAEGIESQQSQDEAESGQDNRGRIAYVLDLPPGDPRVSAWFTIVSDFSAWMTFRVPPPDPDAVRQHFENLSSLLFGKIGPYFPTQAELDAFLALEDPTKEDTLRLQPYLLRLSQRRYFYDKVKDPRWAVVLEEVGCLSVPRDAPVDQDGRRPAVPWPEGQFVARVAGAVPDTAVAVFQRIPRQLVNPIVRRMVPRAALALPAAYRTQLLSVLKDGLRSEFADYVAEETAEVALTMLPELPDAAFEILSYLLLVPTAPPEGADVGLGRERWILPRLPAHWCNEFFADVLPRFLAVQPARLFSLLLEKWDRATGVLQAVDQYERYRLGRLLFEVDRHENDPTELLLGALGMPPAPPLGWGRKVAGRLLAFSMGGGTG